MDLVGLIVKRLDRFPDDLDRLGEVCESWSSVVNQNRYHHLSLNQFPGLMVPDGPDKNSQTRRFLRLNHVTGSFEESANSTLLQVPHRHACRGSAYGWLFLTDYKLNTKLLNPFSGEEIQLPSTKTLSPSISNRYDKWYVYKAVFSSNPSLQPLPVVLVIYRGRAPRSARLAYCKPGDKAWKSLHSNDLKLMDAIFYRGKFYVLSRGGNIMAYEFSRRSVKKTRITIAPAPPPPLPPPQTGLIYIILNVYLLELLDGDLIKLAREIVITNGGNDANVGNNADGGNDDVDEEEEYVDDYTDANSDDDEDDVDYADADEDTDYSEDNDNDEECRKVYNYQTTRFGITKFEANEQKWVEVENLGDNALFLGRNTSFSFPALEYPGCIPNSIYFTRDHAGGGPWSEDSGSDIGIYNLSDKSIKPLCPTGNSMRPCPIWVDSRGSTSRGKVLNHCFSGGDAENHCKSPPIDEHHVSFNQFPGLVVPGTDENSETRCFLQFNCRSFETDVDCDPLPVLHGYVCHGSAYGWVFLVSDELDTKLMNPFTGQEIQLPSVKTLPRASRSFGGPSKWYIRKAIFSSNPSLQPSPLIMVIHMGHTPRLAYCKPGDKSWTSLHLHHRKHSYEDAIFYKDQFYALSHPGYIMAYDIGRRTDDNDHSVKTTLIASAPKGLVCYRESYLVKLDGELIKLTRRVRVKRNLDYDTTGFMIRKLVESEWKWVKVECLGDNALFLGMNTSFALRASEHPGCIPNSIYFTDNLECEKGYNMGIYNLKDRSNTPLYTIGNSELIKPSSVWVTRVPEKSDIKADPMTLELIVTF